MLWDSFLRVNHTPTNVTLFLVHFTIRSKSHQEATLYSAAAAELNCISF